MIEFTIDSKEYSIGDITINDYYKIQSLLVTEGIQAKMQIVSHLSGASVKELGTLSQYEFVMLWDSILHGPLGHTDDSRLYKHFELNGKLYGFMEFSKMTISEFADMEVLKQDPLVAGKLHVMMAVLYRPATQIHGEWIHVEEYDGDKVMERSEIFKEMPLKYVYGALNFFLLVQKHLLRSMLDSLTLAMTPKMMKELTKEQAEIVELMNNLILEWQEAGQIHYMDWQAMILPSLDKLKELTQSLYSTSSPIKKIKSKKKSRLVNWLRDKTNIKK